MTEGAPEKTLTIQTIAMPADTNANGDIFGGWLMAQMDLGAAVIARTRSRGRVTTIAVEGLTFHRPVRVGDIVSIYATLDREGTTSMTIGIEAWVARSPEGERMQVTEATFVYVAIDQNGRKRPLPPLA